VEDALIVDAVRSPIGRRNGTLASLRADELAGQVLNALVERNDLDPAEVEDVQMGCVSQVGEQGWNIGRMAPLVAGWPDSVPGTTVDRQCGSSMQCNFNAATAVWSGQLELVVAAGVESMSRVPMGSSGGDLSPTLFSTVGDTAMNGVYLFLAFEMSSAEGSRIFRVGDVSDYRIISETRGRLLLAVTEEEPGRASEPVRRNRRVLISWTPGPGGTPPRTVRIATAPTPGRR